MHAYSFLNPGGILIGLMSESPFFRADNHWAGKFRAWFEQIGGQSAKLPAGTFKDSGTVVHSCVVAVLKKTGDRYRRHFL